MNQIIKTVLLASTLTLSAFGKTHTTLHCTALYPNTTTSITARIEEVGGKLFTGVGRGVAQVQIRRLGKAKNHTYEVGSYWSKAFSINVFSKELTEEGNTFFLHSNADPFVQQFDGTMRIENQTYPARCNYLD